MNIKTSNMQWYLLSLPFCRRECLSAPERSVHTYVFRRVMALPGMLFYRQRNKVRGRYYLLSLWYSVEQNPPHIVTVSHSVYTRIVSQNTNVKIGVYLFILQKYNIWIFYWNTRSLSMLQPFILLVYMYTLSCSQNIWNKIIFLLPSACINPIIIIELDVLTVEKHKSEWHDFVVYIMGESSGECKVDLKCLW